MVDKLKMYQMLQKYKNILIEVDIAIQKSNNAIIRARLLKNKVKTDIQKVKNPNWKLFFCLSSFGVLLSFFFAPILFVLLPCFVGEWIFLSRKEKKVKEFLSKSEERLKDLTNIQTKFEDTLIKYENIKKEIINVIDILQDYVHFGKSLEIKQERQIVSSIVKILNNNMKLKEIDLNM